MDLLKSLRAFEAVVEAGGFAAAAREMGLSRAVVNHQVQQLEAHLGTQLLARSTRKVTPTESGAAFYERSRTILADLDNAVSDLSESHESVRGSLRINAPMTFGTTYLASAIAQFCEQYPDVHCEVTLSDRFVNLIEEGFDVTLRIAEAEYHTSVATEVIGTTERVLCASPAFAKANELRSPADLKHVRCLHYGLQQTGQRWQLNGPDGETSVKVNCVMWSNNGDVLRAAALNHQGVVMLPTFVVGAALQSGALQRILPEYSMSPLDVFLLYPRHRHLTRKIRVFVEFLKMQFEGRPPWTLVS